jgi:hypothetical protein
MEGWTEDRQLAQAEPSWGEKIVLSIYTRSHWRKSVWRKVVEAEWLTDFVNVNVVGKRGGGRRKMVG